MEFFFVTVGKKNPIEIQVIKELKPAALLLSFFYWKNFDLGEFIKEIGYTPKILFDSGAYSSYTSGKEVELQQYVSCIKKNNKYIWRYISLDKLGDDKKSFDAFMEMKEMGLNPVPVFHYMGDESYLRKYIESGETFIALGGTVPIKSKNKVAEWVRMLSWMYPEVRFHLLGSGSRKILDHCDIQSADASTWIMGAVMGKPKMIPGNDEESKKKRASFNMNKYIEMFG